MSHRSHPSLEVTLPENLMFDVLSRVPVKTIVTCKCVCKRWRGLVEDPYFVDLHLSRSREEALMVRDRGTLKCLEIEHRHLVTFKNIWFGGFVLYPVGSVKGLMFCCSLHGSLYILNPVLEQYMTLPPFPPRHLVSLMTFGYGFGVSTAGEYKVVKISVSLSETAVEIQVHTLGTEGWRSLRQTPPNNLNLGWLQGPGVYLNSHLYWLTDVQIYDFDLGSETSELFPYPPAAPEDNQKPDRMLGVLKGRLSCICWSSSGVEVWVMKEESTKWYKEITVTKPPVIELERRPLCLIDSVEGTSVLLVYVQVTEADKHKLVAYCLDTNKILNESPFSWSNSLLMITYRPSFVKLDNFGSERVHAMYKHNPRGLKKT